MIEPGQIYFLRSVVSVGAARYSRPCLILRVSKHDATICYFSTKLDLREPGEVLLLSTDPDFKASGLRDSSFIIDEATPDVDLAIFKKAKFLGHANGDFKKRVEEWYGLPLK